MHAKSDSEVTSIPGSSPPRSPRHSLLLRPSAYYVQSPSRDSHDGGDGKLSFQSSPLLSPGGSPLHPLATSSSNSSLPPARNTKHHSRRGAMARSQPQPPLTATSSSSTTTSPSSSRHISSVNDGYHKKLLPSTIYEDEDEYGMAGTKKSGAAIQICTFLFVIVACLVLLSVFILFFWLITRPSRPSLSIKNIVFHDLYEGQGTDASGVPSMLLTANCTVQIDFENRSRYFGAHLDPLSVDLRYSELSIASKQMDGYVQGTNSRRVISMVMEAWRVPLYGASAISSTTKPSVPVTALISVCTRYYMIGNMVKSGFCSSVTCNLAVSTASMALLTPIKSACVYDPPLTLQN